jgi:hypothetical protein
MKMDLDPFGRIFGASHNVVIAFGAPSVAAPWEQRSGREQRFKRGPGRS